MTKNLQQLLAATSLALLSQWAEAAIVQDSIWTDHDWYSNSLNMGIDNGVPYSNDPEVNRRLTSPFTFDGHVEDYMSMANAQLVNQIFPASMWDDAFPHANDVYTHADFLKSVAKFPSFCGENNLGSKYTLEQTCRRELSTMFAHWGQETGWRNNGISDPFWKQGLYHVREIWCGTYNSWNWSKQAWPPQDGVNYCGRGPMQLSWNYNYGQFSNVFNVSKYDSKMELLIDPAILERDGYAAFAAGIWFYMTPQDPKPSIHDVVTGFFEPNDLDLAAGMTASFASTINIINGGLECGQGEGTSDKVAKRGEYYTEWLNFFDMPAEQDLDCGSQPNRWPNGSASDIEMYFTKGDTANTCKFINTQTQWSAVARDDYKRCVCENWGNGASDCPQADSPAPGPEPSPSPPGPTPTPPEPTPTPPEPTPTPPGPEPSPQPEPQPTPEQWTTEMTLEQIHANPHYNGDYDSRTMYQVDNSVSLLEQKFKQLFDAVEDKGLI